LSLSPVFSSKKVIPQAGYKKTIKLRHCQLFDPQTYSIWSLKQSKKTDI